MDRYWQHDRALGMATLYGQPAQARLKSHLFTERYAEPAEINWLGLGEGERTYVFMRPYLTLPSSLPAAQPTRRAAVVDAELYALFGALCEHPRVIERGIGTASAIYYPAVQGLVVWEFHLLAPFRLDDPAEDATYQRLWRGMEDHLLDLFPQTRFLVTPDWDPNYAEDAYERFLVAVGYLPHLGHERLFLKSR